MRSICCPPCSPTSHESRPWRAKRQAATSPLRRSKARPIQESPRSAWLALADNLASAMVFLSFFVSHWIAQAMAWANASANMAWRLVFDLLAPPPIHLAGARDGETFFVLPLP